MEEMEAQKNHKDTKSQANETRDNEKTLKVEEDSIKLSSTSKRRHGTLEDETTNMRQTVDQQITLRNMTAKELTERQATVDELQKMLAQEKQHRIRLEDESRLVTKHCNELEEKLQDLLTQMLTYKELMHVVGVDTSIKQSVKTETVPDILNTMNQRKITNLETELTQIRTAYNEVKKRSENKIAQMQRTLDNEIMEKEALFGHTRTKLEENLSRERADYNELVEIFDQEIKQMQQRLDNEYSLRCSKDQELRERETVLHKLQMLLKEEEQSREEMKRRLTVCNETEQSLQNQLSQLQRKLAHLREAQENETFVRDRLEQQLKENEAIVDQLQTTLSEEQKTRNRVEEELSQERIAGEILKNELGVKQRLFEIEERLRKTKETQLREKTRIVGEAEERISTMEDELNEVRSSSNEHIQRLELELGQIRRTINIKEQELSDTEHQLEIRTNDFREQCRLLEEERQQKATLEERLRSMQRDMMTERNRHVSIERQLQSQLSTAQEALAECQSRVQPRDWIIRREEVVVSERSLGRGAWGSVYEGTFRGCQVAVKKIHELILSDHNRGLFEREMNIASRCRHPNLLQFIAATNDDGSPLFVTELLDKSLRQLLSDRALNHDEICNLALDVARGLNYLHLNKPLPIVHRDISSANVLLWRRGEGWRAKLSDYGSANFVRQVMTVGPGASIYAAPEATSSNSQQSTKVRVLFIAWYFIR